MQVLSYNEAAAKAGFVRRTLERLIADGEGPPVINLSPRRRGILDSDLTKWLLKRRRPAPGAADAKDVTRLNSTSSLAYGRSVDALLDARRSDPLRAEEQGGSILKAPRRRAAGSVHSDSRAK
jgi:predicted DNA-binding transcriptional regulator AlpA